MKKFFILLGGLLLASSLNVKAEEATGSNSNEESSVTVVIKNANSYTTSLTKDADGTWTLADFLESEVPFSFRFEKPEAVGDKSAISITSNVEIEGDYYYVLDSEGKSIEGKIYNYQGKGTEIALFNPYVYNTPSYSYVKKQDAAAEGYEYTAYLTVKATDENSKWYTLYLSFSFNDSQDGDSSVVTVEPEGTVKWFSEKSLAYSVGTWGYVDYAVTDGFAKKMVFSEDGRTIWMRNPVCKFPTDTWVKATIEGETITLPMGQVIRLSEAKDGSLDVWTIGAMAMEKEWNEEFQYWRTEWVPTDLEAITFTYKDGYITQNEKDTMLALMCNGEYMVYGDVDIEMSPINPVEDIVRFPENVEIENWTFSYGLSTRLGYPVEAAWVGDEVYMRGFWQENPTATIKGTVKDGVLSFPSQQYIGYINRGGIDYFLYFMPCVVGEQGMITYYQPVVEPLVFNIDSATGQMTQPIEDMNSALKLMIKGGKFDNFDLTKTTAFLLLDNPAIKVMTGDYGMPQAPVLADPCYRYFEGTVMPFVQLSFAIQPFDEEGNALSPSALTYSIWVDDEIVTFESGDFPNWEKIPEPMTALPLDFSNSWGVTYDDNVYNRRVQVPYPDPEKVGAQVIFADPNTGEVKKSQIAYYYPATKEIKYEYEPGSGSSVGAASTADIVGIEYYDMLGGKVGSDFRGLCVKVVTHADGSVKSVKTVR